MTRPSCTADPPTCKSLPGLAAVAQVARWAAADLTGQKRAGWRVMEDTDGAVILMPLDGAEPGFAILQRDREYEVLVCDPEATEELGPFGSFEAALGGISWWLDLPLRWLDLSASDRLRDGGRPAA